MRRSTDAELLYEAGRYSDGSPMRDTAGTGLIPPQWVADAWHVENDIHTSGWRLRRWKLTPDQIADLDTYYEFRDTPITLLGHPVVVKETK